MNHLEQDLYVKKVYPGCVKLFEFFNIGFRSLVGDFACYITPNNRIVFYTNIGRSGYAFNCKKTSMECYETQITTLEDFFIVYKEYIDSRPFAFENFYDPGISDILKADQKWLLELTRRGIECLLTKQRIENFYETSTKYESILKDSWFFENREYIQDDVFSMEKNIKIELILEHPIQKQILREFITPILYVSLIGNLIGIICKYV